MQGALTIKAITYIPHSVNFITIPQALNSCKLKGVTIRQAPRCVEFGVVTLIYKNISCDDFWFPNPRSIAKASFEWQVLRQIEPFSKAIACIFLWNSFTHRTSWLPSWTSLLESWTCLQTNWVLFQVSLKGLWLMMCEEDVVQILFTRSRKHTLILSASCSQQLVPDSQGTSFQGQNSHVICKL